MSGFHTVEVAEQLLASDTRGTWSLADAVLADVPEMPERGGGAKNGPRRSLEEQLAAVMDALIERGITTPNGDPYTVRSLSDLRHTAMSWPEASRHDEAAYRTHQDAGSPDSERGKVLAALCGVARGERVKRPSMCSEDAWTEAMFRVKEHRGRRFPVSANDLRSAVESKLNIPAARPDTEIGLLASVSSARQALRDVVRAFPEIEVEEDTRTALVKALHSIIELCQGLVSAFQGVTDSDLSALLEEADDGRL